MRDLILREFPLFSAFFVSAIGAGGNTIARPLFSASFGVSLFFVALVNTTGPIARLAAAPLAGSLADRWGRRPIIMAGLATRALSSFLAFFATSYVQFLLLEFLGSVGLAIWTTGGTIVVADVSGASNRGRAVALRTSSQRLGNLCGPIIAGILGVRYGLRYIFLLNAAGKMIAFLIFLFIIRESRPESATAAATGPRRQAIFPRPKELGAFLTRPVLAVLFATMAINLVSGAGAFEVLFPIHAANSANFTTLEIGQMITIAGLATFLISLPNGVIMDKFGRKASLLPGLAILAVASYMMAGVSDFWGILVAIVILGIGDGMCIGAAQVLSMDLAPEERRGAFLGVWSLLTSVGGIVVPLALGSYAQFSGTGNAFIAASLWLLVAVPVLGVFGPETKVSPAPAVGQAT